MYENTRLMANLQPLSSNTLKIAFVPIFALTLHVISCTKHLLCFLWEHNTDLLYRATSKAFALASHSCLCNIETHSCPFGAGSTELAYLIMRTCDIIVLLSASDSAFVCALCLCAIQSVDAAGCVTLLHACCINTQSYKKKYKNRPMVPFQAVL